MLARQPDFWGSAPDLGSSSITDEVDFGSADDVKELEITILEDDVPSDDAKPVYPTDPSARGARSQ